MTLGTLVIDSGTGARHVALADYLDAAAQEHAASAAIDWIKSLRHADVDGQPMRRRFTYRGDSLWWFTELYLHKTQTIERILRTILALEHLIERERPLEIRAASDDRLLRGLTLTVARVRNIRCPDTGGFDARSADLMRLRWRARALTFAAYLSRLKPRRVPVSVRGSAAAFVHRAFWAAGRHDGAGESYIGAVLSELERRVPRGGVGYVGVGPTENFAARRWWRASARNSRHAAVVPIETYAPLSALTGSRRLWRQRHEMLRALWHSAALRQLSVIRGCDCWPLVREELAGVALLQWPWSARAMDEAAAALDVLRPRVVVTYAEAGGWGRAIMLECRRKGIPSVGLQHGFIYRHWLNYRHEPDEMQRDEGNTPDAGFPRPSLTLVFDGYAARHLQDACRFPPEALAVTGSARLDALVSAANALSDADLETTRQSITGSPGGSFLLVVAKFREARAVLPGFIAAAGALPEVHIAIKTHPAETPDVYAQVVAGAPRVRVLPASAPLAPLLRAARAVVTVNSTVALDAVVLGVPALVVGLPNNLSPLVDAGVMAGASSPAEIAPLLRRILYDQGFRQQLADEREAFLRRFEVNPDGGAARRAAEAVLRLSESRT